MGTGRKSRASERAGGGGEAGAAGGDARGGGNGAVGREMDRCCALKPCGRLAIGRASICRLVAAAAGRRPHKAERRALARPYNAGRRRP